MFFTRTAAAMVSLIMRKDNRGDNTDIVVIPSIFSAIHKLRLLLTRQEKFKWLSIVGFSLILSLLEVMTASVIILFAQALNQPEMGQKYLLIAGFNANLSFGRILSYLAIVIGVIYLVKNILGAIEVFYQNFLIQKMSFHFKNKLLHRYAEVDYGFYLTRNSSLGMAVVGGDADIIFSSGMTSVATILSEGFVFVFLLSMIVFMNPSLALVVSCIGVVLGLIITKGLLPQFYRWGQRLQEATVYAHENLLQFFHAFKEIILLGKRDVFVKAYQYHSYKKSRVQAIQTAANAIPRMVIEVLFVGLFVVTIVILCFEQENPVEMIGILGGYLYAGFRLMPGLNRVINQLNSFKAIIPSIERIYNEYNTLSSKQTYVNIPNFVFEKSINVRNLSFMYLNTEKDALKDIEFDIAKGECIGIVGETGSGKSTLVDVILGLLKPYKGAVLLDEQYSVHSFQWHQKIGYVPQSIYLIDDTIEANIAFGEKEIDSSQINAVIDAAQLRNLIDQLPQGYKTIVGERGVRLSGGERQRIAIARALYRNPEVLIFDEATSALDNETEARLMETIRVVSQNRTVIMVAHRFTTLEGCDRILEMEGGSIKQITTYENLQDLKVKNHA